MPAQCHHADALHRCPDPGPDPRPAGRQAEDKILAFRCHWCSYGGADLAGTSHFEYSANERGLRVMCSARMDTDFIYEAYRLGAGAVLYSGCHPQDCHYITGQRVGATRAERLHEDL